MNAKIPFEVMLWTTKEIGDYLGIAPKSVQERYASEPSFPKPVRLPKTDGGAMHPRWFAVEIVDWVRRFKP